VAVEQAQQQRRGGSVSNTERPTALPERDLVIAAEAGDADASRTLVEAYLTIMDPVAEEAYEHVLGEPCAHAAPAGGGAT
jgi:hypothetical protein